MPGAYPGQARYDVAVRVACPDCTNPIEAAPGEEVVCPACFTRFDAPSSTQVPRRFDVYLPDGTVHMRQTMYALREAIYAGKVPITARLRPDVGAEELVPVYAFPWFAQIYALLGIEPPASAGTRRIAGWQGIRKSGPKAVPPAAHADEKLKKMVKNASVPALLALGVAVFFVLLLGAVLIVAL